MRYETHPCEVKLSAAGGPASTGAAVDIRRFRNKTVTVDGTFNATVSLQGKIDGGDWHDIQTGINAAAVVAIATSGGAELAYTWLRVVTTAYATGTPVVTFAGLDTRAQ